MKKLGVFVTAGFEEIEALTVADIARRAGINVIIIAAAKQHAVSGSHKIIVIADEQKKDVNFSRIDGIVLPGGMPGTINLQNDITVQQVTKEFVENGKLVAAICAAPGILGEAGFLEGKKATCHPGFESKLIGAEFVEEDVVRDGNIITSRGMGTAIPFGLAIVEYFLGKEKADEISEELVYSR